MNIGLFGGTFDPPHNGHLRIARAMMQQLDIGRLFFIPAGTPYHKNIRPSAHQDRIAMIQAAIAQDIGMTYADTDLKRVGNTYTVDTLADFSAQFPHDDLWWLIGADSLAYLHHWHQAERLFELARFVVAPRPDADITPPPNTLTEHAAQNGRLFFLKADAGTESSSAIRRLYAQNRVDEARIMLPEKVADYIEQHGLYGFQAAL